MLNIRNVKLKTIFASVKESLKSAKTNAPSRAVFFELPCEETKRPHIFQTDTFDYYKCGLTAAFSVLASKTFI